MSIHPTSGGLGNKQGSKNALAARIRQIRQALDIYSSQENENTIILGDLNAGPELDKTSYELFSPNGFVNIYKLYAENNDLKPKPTWDERNILIIEGTHSHVPSQRIDHIFFSRKLLKKVTLKKVCRTLDQPLLEIDEKQIPLSDHYAIQAILDFEKRIV